MKRDYTHGELAAAEWRELRADLAPELDAAKAEAERLRERLDAAGVAAVRSALLRLFDGFTLRRDIPDGRMSS